MLDSAVLNVLAGAPISSEKVMRIPLQILTRE
jgi:hypothetical protein